MTNKILYPILAVLLGTFWYGVLTLAFWISAHTGGRTYDCSLAEISPDFTADMRKQCRELRSTKL